MIVSWESPKQSTSQSKHFAQLCCPSAKGWHRQFLTHIANKTLRQQRSRQITSSTEMRVDRLLVCSLVVHPFLVCPHVGARFLSKVKFKGREKDEYERLEYAEMSMVDVPEDSGRPVQPSSSKKSWLSNLKPKRFSQKEIALTPKEEEELNKWLDLVYKDVQVATNWLIPTRNPMEGLEAKSPFFAKNTTIQSIREHFDKKDLEGLHEGIIKALSEVSTLQGANNVQLAQIADYMQTFAYITGAGKYAGHLFSEMEKRSRHILKDKWSIFEEMSTNIQRTGVLVAAIKHHWFTGVD